MYVIYETLKSKDFVLKVCFFATCNAAVSFYMKVLDLIKTYQLTMLWVPVVSYLYEGVGLLKTGEFMANGQFMYISFFNFLRFK